MHSLAPRVKPSRDVLPANAKCMNASNSESEGVACLDSYEDYLCVGFTWKRDKSKAKLELEVVRYVVSLLTDGACHSSACSCSPGKYNLGTMGDRPVPCTECPAGR